MLLETKPIMVSATGNGGVTQRQKFAPAPIKTPRNNNSGRFSTINLEIQNFLTPHTSFDHSKLIDFISVANINNEQRIICFQQNGKLMLFDEHPLISNKNELM